MSKYTVVLLRPNYLVTDTLAGDSYVASVEAAGVTAAIAAARREVFECDKKDELGLGLGPKDPDDYAVVAVFAGYPQQVAYGCESR